jgi:hypothetical protein
MKGANMKAIRRALFGPKNSVLRRIIDEAKGIFASADGLLMSR